MLLISLDSQFLNFAVEYSLLKNCTKVQWKTGTLPVAIKDSMGYIYSMEQGIKNLSLN